MNLKKVALNNLHEKLGARMVPFAGYNMPLKYVSETEEHLNVRNNVGVFDVSHMGEFVIQGSGALQLIQHVTSNDAELLIPGKIQYSCLPNGQGGIVDDLLVYQLEADKYMLVVNASNIEKDWNWISKHNQFGAQILNISDDTSLLALQGPRAIEVLKKLTTLAVEEMKYYTFQHGNILDILPDALISATGYTGAGGFELYVPNDKALPVWEALFEAGKEFGIMPIGLGARDTLRLEKGFCLYGNDIDDSTSPIEAGLGWITKFSKTFIDSERLKTQKETGVDRKLVGFVMKEKGFARHGYELYNEQDEQIGVVTSGTISPILNVGIGMGYVTSKYAQPGSSIYVSIRNKKLLAEVTKMPFVKN
ncbi:MAG: glycine cleavage system aminomethyltransferase GcvT [Cyclobacteriaceae bacterium]